MIYHKQSKISITPGFRMKCNQCVTGVWLKVETFERRDYWACPSGHGGEKCKGTLEIQFATAPDGILTVWDTRDC